MSPISLRLSVEELAVVLYQSGNAHQADELISAHFGSIPREEMAARLVTASNSLMARELLTPDVLINKLDASLQKMGEVIGTPDFSILCSRNSLWNLTEISYHFHQSATLENKIVMKVVHEITEMPDIDTIIMNQVSFMQMNEAKSFECQTAVIPNLALSEFLDQKENIPIMERLREPEFGVMIPDETRLLFGEDWENSQYWGLFLRYEKGLPPLFERGFLILRGEKRFWLMHPVVYDDELMMKVIPAVQSTFEKALKELIQ